MKIKNKSIKIIGVGSQTVMPDEEIVVSDSMFDSPALKVMKDLGYIEIEKAVDEPMENPVEVESTEETEVEAEPKKRTRGKKASE